MPIHIRTIIAAVENILESGLGPGAMAFVPDCWRLVNDPTSYSFRLTALTQEGAPLGLKR